VPDGASAPLITASALPSGREAPCGPAFAYVRPHDLQLYPQTVARADGIAADVRRVIARGASVRVELMGEAGLLEAELAREAWHALRLAEGDRVTVVPRASRVFEAQ